MMRMLNEWEVRALRMYYEKFAEKLYCYQLALCENDQELAEDLCQEVWVSLAGKLKAMKGWKEKQVLAWLRLTARIKYRRFACRGSARCEFPEASPQREEEGSASTEDIVLAQLLFKETFGELEETEKELVRCKLQGLSYQERHPEDTRSENALAVRCSRAFQKWRQELEKEWPEYI